MKLCTNCGAILGGGNDMADGLDCRCCKPVSRAPESESVHGGYETGFSRFDDSDLD